MADLIQAISMWLYQCKPARCDSFIISQLIAADSFIINQLNTASSFLINQFNKADSFVFSNSMWLTYLLSVIQCDRRIDTILSLILGLVKVLVWTKETAIPG